MLTVTANPMQLLPLDRIEFPDYQLRQSFEPDALARLAQTIEAHGILEPLVVRAIAEERYELVAGARRYRAAQQAGLSEVPVCVRELDDEKALELALQENLVREDLNPLEETDGILKLLAAKLRVEEQEVISLLYQMRNQQGKSRRNVSPNSQAQIVEDVFAPLKLTWKSFVETRLPLLKLPEDILGALRSGEVTYTKAKAIAKLSDEDSRQGLLDEAIANDLSLSKIRQRLKSLRQPSAESETDLESETDAEIDSSTEVEDVEEMESVEELEDSDELPPPIAQFQATAQRMRATKLWKHPKQWQQAQQLLSQLEALIAEAEREGVEG